MPIIFLKSARFSLTLFISWNLDIRDRLEVPPPLCHVIPHMLRVNEIRLYPSKSRSDYVKCKCGEREGMGAPCMCSFKHCDVAELTDQEMIDPCMLDVRYWKIYHTHYPGIVDGVPETEGSLGDIIVRAQKELFTNESKGICVPRKVVEALVRKNPGQKYPILGKKTPPIKI